MAPSSEDRNLIVKGSRLTTDQSRNILYGYLLKHDAAFLANATGVSEPAVYRLVGKFQQRLLADPELLAICMGLRQAGNAMVPYWTDVISSMLNYTDEQWTKIHTCLFNCPAHSSFTPEQWAALNAAKGLDGLGKTPGTTYHYREKWCADCQANLQDHISILTWQVIVQNNAQRTYITPTTIKAHFPAMLIDIALTFACMHAPGITPQNFKNYFQERVGAVFVDALLYLEKDPL